MHTMVQPEKRWSLILSDYMDIFSSFDPRGYNEKALSDDFLQECKKILHANDESHLSLHLLLPHDKRDESQEYGIIKRLHGYFHGQFQEVAKELQWEKRRGIWFMIMGFCIGVGITYMIQQETQSLFILTFLTVIGEPASWFLLRTGGDILLHYMSYKRPDYLFYQRMSHATIQFHSY